MAVFTRMHSSTIRTGHSLTVCRGGVCFWGGVCFQGVSAPGGCLLLGWAGRVSASEGCLLLILGGVWADSPP